VIGILAISFELFINLLSYDLDWRPVKSSVGNYACNPPTYPNGFNFTMEGDLEHYLNGEMRPGNVYSYGMPLHNGMIGGWGAKPTDRPKDVVFTHFHLT
jgi:hypothetical protein